MAQTAIDSTVLVKIGGIEQVIYLKGTDRSKPLLLFLHGGPGNSAMHYAEKFTSELQKHFVVVQWDQRESGKTVSRNKSSEPLSVRLFEDDTHEVIDTLLKVFNHSKLYLAGHSWGTYLGFFIAKKYPELLHAYIAICPMINQLESEKIVLDLMMAKARSRGNKTALRELATVKIPFQNGDQLYFHRKWLLDYMGSKAKITNGQVNAWASTWLRVFNEASKENLFKSASRIECPVYFFVGRNDYQTNSTITEKYYHALRAPKKDLFWFKKSAHSLPTAEPGLLQETIINNVIQK